ncbi:hypothetical protein QLX67_09225 [Balneolaceae bacterium ANBcel3]|nr:hypothetical protein [Balneolaceae bacterium ANBcel3]
MSKKSILLVTHSQKKGYNRFFYGSQPSCPSFFLWIFLLTFPLFIATSAPVYAQWTMGAGGIAMGQAHTADHRDAWAVFHNPAQISPHDFSAGFFSIRYYGLRELQDHAAFISSPLPFAGETFQAGIAAGLHTYGFELYRETRMRSGFSLMVSGIRWGITVTYAHVQISDRPSVHHLLFDTGFSVPLSSSFVAAVRISNLLEKPASPSAGASSALTENPNVPLFPQELAFGLQWLVFCHTRILLDVVKDTLYPAMIRTGLEYSLMDGFLLRTGWTSRPFTWAAGFEVSFSSLSAEVAIQHHEILGYSPGISCRISL